MANFARMNATTQSEEEEEVIVSLTSFPPAIEFAVGAVKSILAGSVLPDRVVLYLTRAEFGDRPLPAELTALAASEPRFEIRDFPRNIRSYRKLVPALRDFPRAVIVTVDDDVAYDRHMLRDLLAAHRRHPADVIAHRAKRVIPDRPYREWPKLRWYHFLAQPDRSGCLTMQTGVGGVLYPPGALRADMIDEELFSRLAPTADDIWFWGAAVANGRKIRPTGAAHNKPRGLGKPRSLSLKTVNFKQGADRNDAAFRALLAEFPEIARRLN